MDIRNLLNLDSALFREQNKGTARKLFNKWVETIEIEAFSYCNRNCWFCPNSSIDRKSNNSYLDFETYKSILNDLSSIGFSGQLSFSRYNEPFSDERIFDYISLARKILPKVRIHSNTNGDYLSFDMLEKATKSGLDSIVAQLYLPKNKNNIENVIKYKAIFDSKFDNKISSQLVKEDIDWLEWNYEYDGLRFSLRWRDFSLNGVNRANIPVGQQRSRISPCILPVRSIYIDYNGSIMPCCNLRSDYEQHKQAILGVVSEDISLFDIYGNKKSAAWRKSLSDFSSKEGVCEKCTFDELELQKVGSMLMKKNKELRDLNYKLKKSNIII